jgi:hypothetical protein
VRNSYDPRHVELELTTVAWHETAVFPRSGPENHL